MIHILQTAAPRKEVQNFSTPTTNAFAAVWNAQIKTIGMLLQPAATSASIQTKKKTNVLSYTFEFHMTLARIFTIRAIRFATDTFELNAPECDTET